MNEMTNSHILVGQFDYYEPGSLLEAFDLLEHFGSKARILAGGTDLFVQMKIERISPEVVVNISKIPGLDTIESEGNRLKIGALATIRAVEMDALIRAHFPALVDACASFSTTQVQAMGTIGGNLGNGSPAADTAPALIALGAEIELSSRAGKRCLPLEQFFTGPGRTNLRTGELITNLYLPQPPHACGSAFLKIARVTADIAKASAAVLLVRDPDDPDRIQECRIAFGSVAPVPFRSVKAEAIMTGQSCSEENVLEAARAASEEIMPIDDVRSTARYRRDVVRALTYDALMNAWHRLLSTSERGRDHSPAPQKVYPEKSSKTVHSLAAGEKQLVELNVNGRKEHIWAASHDLLLNVLRDQLELTGTKYGCGIGECSACTVLIDGVPALSCLILAVSAVGKDIQTVEGLQKPDGALDPLQEAFIEKAAYQCGYCTPGMLMTSKSLLAEIPQPSEEDIRHYLRGNLCRCTGYTSIVQAVLAAAAQAER